MTDKVQKIKEWISKEQDGLMDAQGNFEYPEHEGAYHILCNLDAYIDSLQEEPVSRTSADIEAAMQEVDEKSKVFTEAHQGEDADTILAQMRGEEPVRGDFEMALAEMIDNAQKCVVEPWVVAAQWKDELVKLAKECKAVQEHPKDCMYSKDNYTDEDRKILCEGCEEDCKYNKKEEPVSEDLEEAADNALSNVLNNHEIVNVRSCLEMFRFGSKWQEEKDNEEKVLIYKHGFDDCKEHINEVLLSEVLPCFMHGREADEVVAKLNEIEL